VKIMKEEGEGRGNEIRGRKRRSPFSPLKSSPHSFLSFPSYRIEVIPSFSSLFSLLL